LATVLCALAVGACASEESNMTETAVRAPVNSVSDTSVASALRALASRRIYFAHQSVGANLVSGLQTLLSENASSGVTLVETHEPAKIQGPAFIHFLAGRNEDPASKNADFLRVLDARPVRDGGIALMKYCYIDVHPGTNIEALFADYRQVVARVHERHPDLTIVHVTMPLTTDASGPKATIKRMLGRVTARELNEKRSRFNAMLRRTFAGEPIFDLAALEATHADGRQERVTVRSQPVYAMAHEYTTDGGHLTPAAERRFAASLVTVLANATRTVGN
jgi:hypothetical protein